MCFSFSFLFSLLSEHYPPLLCRKLPCGISPPNANGPLFFCRCPSKTPLSFLFHFEHFSSPPSFLNPHFIATGPALRSHFFSPKWLFFFPLFAANTCQSWRPSSFKSFFFFNPFSLLYIKKFSLFSLTSIVSVHISPFLFRPTPFPPSQVNQCAFFLLEWSFLFFSYRKVVTFFSG